MSYSVWGIIIIGFLLLTPSLCLFNRFYRRLWAFKTIEYYEINEIKNREYYET